MTQELAKSDQLSAIPLLEEFTARLNQQVDQTRLLKTPDGKASYLPISYIETMLREDFAGAYQITIHSERRELNEYIVVARISVYHPIIKQWLNYDGIAASQIMQDKDATLSSFNDTKKKNALMLNAPKTYSEAVKNAAKKIGKKYGADLNRQYEDTYEPIYTNEVQATEVLEDMLPKINNCQTLDELGLLFDSLEDHEKQNSKIKIAFTNQKNILRNAK